MLTCSTHEEGVANKASPNKKQIEKILSKFIYSEFLVFKIENDKQTSWLQQYVLMLSSNNQQKPQF